MAERFPGYGFTGLTTTDTLPDTTPRAARDVAASFARMDTTGDLLGANINRTIRGARYTFKNFGDSRADIHFQGIQRARDGIHAFVTGGDNVEPAAHLFVVRMGSRMPHGGWGSNLVRSRQPADEDVIASVLALDDVHWHGGGPGLLGDLLAVPLEAKQRNSRTMFFDVTDPLRPLHIARLDIEGPSDKAGAAALAHFGDIVVCGVYRDEPLNRPPGVPPGVFDLYALDTVKPQATFSPLLLDWSFGLTERPRPNPKYQAVAFVPELTGDGAAEPALFLIASENTAEGAPTLPGQDMVDLYRVDLKLTRVNGDVALDRFALQHVDTRILTCRDIFANLDAVGGAHVDAFGRLMYYGGYHWRVEEALHLSEFRCRLAADAPPIHSMDEAWIELYEHREFAGRRLSIIGMQDATIADYRRISVQGAGFNNELSSIRFQLPAGAVYRLYEERDFPEQRPHIELVGDGAVQEIRELRDAPWRFADRVSSSRYVTLV